MITVRGRYRKGPIERMIKATYKSPRQVQSNTQRHSDAKLNHGPAFAETTVAPSLFKAFDPVYDGGTILPLRLVKFWLKPDSPASSFGLADFWTGFDDPYDGIALPLLVFLFLKACCVNEVLAQSHVTGTKYQSCGRHVGYGCICKDDERSYGDRR